jgi:hypothetical protein
MKFHEYRSAGKIGSFGDAVLDAVIMAGLWTICCLHVLYLRRALRELAKAEQWSGKAQPAAAAPAVGAAQLAGIRQQPGQDGELSLSDEDCFLLPETETLDDD